MRRARRDTYDTPQAFLNEGERFVGEREAQAGGPVPVHHVAGVADDPPNHVRLRDDTRRDRPVGRRQFQ